MTMKTFEDKLRSIFKTMKENIESINSSIDEPALEPEDDSISNSENIVEPISEPDVAEPDVAEPDVAEPDVAEPDVAEPEVVPFEKPPKFRIYWRAWKDGNNTSGQTESVLDTAQMARAESMTKLYDLGFNDIEILAIETIKNTESETI